MLREKKIFFNPLSAMKNKSRSENYFSERLFLFVLYKHLCFCREIKFTVFSTIGKVYHKPDEQPDGKINPVPNT
jgi:hypothetical protein